MNGTGTLWAMAAAAIIASSTPGEANSVTARAAALQRLSGTYQSLGPEDWGRGTWGTRRFTFARGHWTLDFALALDPAMQRKVFAFRTRGTYAVRAPSAVVPGAYEADFREDAKYVTLLTDEVALKQAFGLAGCDLTPGVEKDVSAEGCAAWRPVSACPDDHDLLMLDARGGLRFGVRPQDNDMCTPDKRPTRVLPAVVRR